MGRLPADHDSTLAQPHRPWDFPRNRGRVAQEMRGDGASEEGAAALEEAGTEGLRGGAPDGE